MSSKKSLVTTTDDIVKEEINDMIKNLMWRRKPSLLPLQQKKIDTINRTEKPQTSKRKRDKSISNKSDKGKSLNKSRSTQ